MALQVQSFLMPQPSDPDSSWRAQLRAAIPTLQELEQQRWLRPVAHRLADPKLWHMKHEAVARGVAIGLFWAFVIPFAQIVFATAHCVWWRGNIPVAAATTFITNPFTVGGWLWAAYHLGSVFISNGTSVADASGWLGKLQALGWPTVLGMAIFAIGGAAVGYLAVRLISRGRLHWKIWQRARRNQLRQQGS
jgi:uncharacterized protein